MHCNRSNLYDGFNLSRVTQEVMNGAINHCLGLRSNAGVRGGDMACPAVGSQRGVPAAACWQQRQSSSSVEQP
jgi:hypothetical protein